MKANNAMQENYEHFAQMLKRYGEMQKEYWNQLEQTQTAWLSQQNKAFKQIQDMKPAARGDNWATATPKVVDKLVDVVKTAIFTSEAVRQARKGEPRILDAEGKPKAALPAAKAAESTPAVADEMERKATAASPAKRVAESDGAKSARTDVIQKPPEAPPPASSTSAAAKADERAKRNPAVTDEVGSKVTSAPPKESVAERDGAKSAQTAEGKRAPEATPPGPTGLTSAAATLSAAKSAMESSKRRALARHKENLEAFHNAQAQMNHAVMFFPLTRMMAQILWREMKRRIISLPDSVLATVIASRENFLAWISWVAEPAAFLPCM